MLFSSFQFTLVFLPLMMAVYYAAGRWLGGRAAIYCLLIGSLVFYAYWDWRYAFLLAGSVLFNHMVGSALLAGRHRGVLVFGVIANLAALGLFKYADFLIENYNVISGAAVRPLGLVLPLGISFFTFTQIAFLVDAADRSVEGLSLPRYALFVTFFPHSIAGPIIHHREMMPQFAEPGAQIPVGKNINAGIAYFVLGLSKKVILADSIAPWANTAFGSPGLLTGVEAWAGLMAYSLQLYFDFSGYSDMAIGLALLFNVKFPENFNAPYQAASFIEFWQRWHMTLSRFLREYLFQVVSFGSPRSFAMRCLALFLTMLIAGLWHGASWNFVLWGSLHGLMVVMNHMWRKMGVALPRGLSRSMTFLLVTLLWVPFRAPNLPSSAKMLAALFGHNGWSWEFLPYLPGGLWQLSVLGILFIAIQILPTAKEMLEAHPLGSNRALALAALFTACLILMRQSVIAKRTSEFIYFQF